MKRRDHTRSLTYSSFLLSLLLLQHPSCIQTRHLAASKTNTTLDDFQIQKSVLLKGGKYTVGNSLCRSDNRCGRNQGRSYSWCYTEDNWDYCCETPCKKVLHGGSVTKCMSGADSYRCSSGLNKITIDGTPCLDTHPCGIHEMQGQFLYYWCYIDTKGNFKLCCNPNHGCSNHGEKYNWCYHKHYFPTDSWSYCTLKYVQQQ
ncbi:hypothetical protein CHS0354_003478 [Potamilus streckersoni]|uniref:Uncharacterized protein n=1 Tax=Potamilus streckersoni TaxID=2493646 RepID=A0AAE0SU60_9BIVA|nr:hypothetical protein CHS0354_003478 [Potamilus streckersoni]